MVGLPASTVVLFVWLGVAFSSSEFHTGSFFAISGFLYTNSEEPGRVVSIVAFRSRVISQPQFLHRRPGSMSDVQITGSAHRCPVSTPDALFYNRNVIPYGLIGSDLHMYISSFFSSSLWSLLTITYDLPYIQCISMELLTGKHSQPTYKKLLFFLCISYFCVCLSSGSVCHGLLFLQEYNTQSIFGRVSFDLASFDRSWFCSTDALTTNSLIFCTVSMWLLCQQNWTFFRTIFLIGFVTSNN